MSYIIHGATGAQGAPLLRRLTKSGKRAIAAVHRNKTVLGIETVSIDNESVDSLVAAYRDADGVFVHLPIADEAARVNYAHKIAQAIAVLGAIEGRGRGMAGQHVQCEPAYPHRHVPVTLGREWQHGQLVG